MLGIGVAEATGLIGVSLRALVAARRIRSDHDVVRMTGDAMGTMGTYIVLAFCCAQFVSWFAPAAFRAPENT